MIIRAHTIIYSKNPEKDRAFFRDVLGFDSVDAGNGWLIFALPPGELAVHPTDGEVSHELYFMCDDITKTMKELKDKKVKCSVITQAGWGSITGGGKLGLYEPRHEMAIKGKK